MEYLKLMDSFTFKVSHSAGRSRSAGRGPQQTRYPGCTLFFCVTNFLTIEKLASRRLATPAVECAAVHRQWLFVSKEFPLVKIFEEIDKRSVQVAFARCAEWKNVGRFTWPSSCSQILKKITVM